MRRLAVMMASAACLAFAGTGTADESQVNGLERWRFLIGDWNVVEKRFGFDSKLLETKPGHASFSRAMYGQRFQELLTIGNGPDSTNALHLFVYDPRSAEVEIARTDSGHYAFWVIIGTISPGRIDLEEKHPDPESDVTRRITYLRTDDDHFVRHLEFSQDRGRTWFLRSEWSYTRD